MVLAVPAVARRQRTPAHRGLLMSLVRLLLRIPGARTVLCMVGGVVALLAVELTAVAWLLRGNPAPVVITVFTIVALASLVLVIAARRRMARRRRLRVRRFESLLALTPTQFEAEIGRLLTDLGYRDVRHVGGAGDLGADLVCRDRAGRQVVVQCKRYGPGRRVGSGDIQSFIGMLTVHHRADAGIFVTTSAFTQPAQDLAREHNVELFDGRRLSGLVASA